MNNIYYALQYRSGQWIGFAQSSRTQGEDNHDEGLRWMDVTKTTFSTEQDAIDNILSILVDHPEVNEFRAFAETDIRYAVQTIAEADASGSDMEKMNAGEQALSTETQRALTARG